ncbi:PLC-like phosphodiesterase [Neocallimastix sp. 'constans']
MKNLLSTFFIACFITLFINVNAEDNEDNIDTHWMEFIDGEKTLNQINIPGTQDSGTFDIARITTNRFVDYFISLGYALYGTILSDFAETQNLDIREQLDHGIRYLDLRMTSDNYDAKNIYISHGSIAVANRNKGSYDYLLVTDVLEECVNFLIRHPSETIILYF